MCCCITFFCCCSNRERGCVGWGMFANFIPKIWGECFGPESTFLELVFVNENDGLGGNEFTGDSKEDPFSAPEVWLFWVLVTKDLLEISTPSFLPICSFPTITVGVSKFFPVLSFYTSVQVEDGTEPGITILKKGLVVRFPCSLWSRSVCALRPIFEPHTCLHCDIGHLKHSSAESMLPGTLEIKSSIYSEQKFGKCENILCVNFGCRHNEN